MSDFTEKYASAWEFLNGLSVYEVRNIARELGFSSPTTEKKGSLAEKIVRVASGMEDPPRKQTNKGAPPKAPKAPPMAV